MNNNNRINYEKDGNTLRIYLGVSILAEIEDGDLSEGFVEEVLNGMGYTWNEDGTLKREEQE